MDLQQHTGNEAEQYAHSSEQDFGADSDAQLKLSFYQKIIA